MLKSLFCSPRYKDGSLFFLLSILCLVSSCVKDIFLISQSSNFILFSTNLLLSSYQIGVIFSTLSATILPNAYRQQLERKFNSYITEKSIKYPHKLTFFFSFLHLFLLFQSMWLNFQDSMHLMHHISQHGNLHLLLDRHHLQNHFIFLIVQIQMML